MAASPCALTNPFPGFPIDFLNDNTGWIDYTLDTDLDLSNNGDGTLTISGNIIDGTPVDFGSGISGTSCGATDGWLVSMTLSDKKTFTEFQAMGGSANVHSNCTGLVNDLDYWDVSGTLTGTGCNVGRTLTIVGSDAPYRIQIGYGGNQSDGSCNFGLSSWLNINEGGTPLQADIYAFLGETCYDAFSCELAITNVFSNNCTGDDTNGYTADWKIGFSAADAPDNAISYQRNSDAIQTHILTGTTDTLTISNIPADGGVYDTLRVWFTNDVTCADTVVLKRPLPCPTTITPLTACSASAAPGTITQQTCDGDRAWNNITNIQTDDATFATTNGNLTFSLPNSNCLEFTNFGFSIPATATITGINISVRRKGETDNSTVDKSIQLLAGGVAIGNDKATIDLWGDASFAATYGGAQDLWGTTLTPTDVNASNFGFTFQAKREASTGEAQIEFVEMSICYSDVATTEVGGAVYEDWNFDGIQADNETSGVQGVQVLVYDCDNNLAATTYTDIYGNYKFTGLSTGVKYRIEFVLPEAIACWAKPTQSGTNNSTTVQFIEAGNLANLGLINLADYCQENPQLVSACFTRGDIATNGSELAILSSFDSEAKNAGTAADAFSTTHNINVPLSDVGSIWGLAYAKNCDHIFAATTVKTQTEIASDGIGAIYVIDNSANTNILGGTDAVTSASLWLDLEAVAIGLNLGDNPYDAEAYTDGFNRATYAGVGKHGIGDIDVAEDGSALFATNLYNRTLLEIPIGANCTAPVSGSEIKEIALPTPASCTDVIRPWAVKVNKGKVYVGMVCSGEQSIANNDDRTGIDRAVLIAYVYEYDPIAGIFGGSPVLEFPLDYDRTWTSTGQPAAWYPWFDRFVWDMYFTKQRTGTDIYTASYAQPILSDIEFDGCNMIIGLMDRAGNQFGYGPPPNDELANGTIQQGYPAGATNILVYPSGDLLLAGANADGTWTIESNGSITSICGNKSTLNGDSQDLRSTLPAPHQSETGAGPSGNEFFWGDYYGTGHGEVTIGGLAISQSSGEVISMAWDPLQHVASEFGIGGAMWLNTNTGAYEKGLKLYENNVLSFQKGSGFGDVELICGDAPIEIGNYVWNDTDKDGIQDACESGINAVVVELVKGGTVIASTQTANGGQYYFLDKNVVDANLTWSGTGADTTLLPNTTYTIRISNAEGSSQQVALSDLELSITNTNSNNSDNIDNDGSLSGDHAEITALTSDFGCVNHSFDFGFSIPSICPTDFCLDNYLLEGSGSFFQVTWDTLLNNWTKPPDDVNLYPYTQTLTIPGSSITVDLTMSRRPRNDNLSSTFSNVAWPSTGPSTINDVDWTSLLGDDEVFRYFKDEAVDDNPVTMTMTFSEPILLYEMVTGNPSGTSGTVIFAAYDDSIAVDVHQDLAVLSANTVPPNPAVHPNPGIGIFETATDDPTLESTVSFFAHNDMGGFNWGVSGDLTNPAPAPMNFMEAYPNGSTNGAPIIGYKDGYYYNLTTASARDWLVMDYAGAKARSISWQLFRETVAFQTDLGNGSATFSDIFSYSELGNRSAYLGPFQVESTTCPDQNHEICLDGSGQTSVDLIVDVAKTSNVVWFNSGDVQVGTGNTLTVSMATSGMAADSMETFYYTGTDIASGCTGKSCCPILVSAVSCCPMNMELTNQSCSDNSTENTSDDYIHFQLNPTGTHLTGTYSVSVSSGSITPTSGNYGIATTFQLQNGSIGAGNITVTLTDDSDNSCTLDTLVIDPEQCVLLEMTKTADVATAGTGDMITYTYQVTNNSLDTLSLSDITDDKLGVISTEIIDDTRVADQLQSLYQFEDGSGTTIMDNSGVSPALDLTIQGVNYTWGIDSLDFTDSNRADNTTDNNKLYQSITASRALTVEAWIQPANNTQGGASRIFSLSADNSNRNFQLMQNQSIYEFRLSTSDDGTNEAETAVGTIAGTPVLQHVVYTFDGTTAQFYINGSPVATSGATNPTGDFSSWIANYDLAIGNENSFAANDAARDWQGEFHLAAVYSKALSAAEISQNYNYGLDFSATPMVLTNGQTASFTASYEVQSSDPEGIYKNIASITGTPTVGLVLMATDSAAVNLLNCDLNITTTYSANCTEVSANNFTADWKIGISTTNELDNIISYQRNSEAVQSHTLTGLTDTLTIAGIPADGGVYDTLKVWFTNASTCADTIILKRPVPCPNNLSSCPVIDDGGFEAGNFPSGGASFAFAGGNAVDFGDQTPNSWTQATSNGDNYWVESSAAFNGDKYVYAFSSGTTSGGNDACNQYTISGLSGNTCYQICVYAADARADGASSGLAIEFDKNASAGTSDFHFTTLVLPDNPAWNDNALTNIPWKQYCYTFTTEPGTTGGTIWISASTEAGTATTSYIVVDDMCVTNCGGQTIQAGEACSSISNTEIKGTVFEDWNYDGIMNQSDTIGVGGVQVFIYDDCNSVLDTTYTDSNGNYQFTGLTTGTTYRIEFTLSEAIACWVKPTQTGVDNGSTVQFAQPGNCASLGIASAGDYCSENPLVITNCYINGDQSQTDDVLVGATYDAIEGVTTKSHISQSNEIGTTWGLAYQRSTKYIYAATFLKRHTGIRPSGAIDEIQIIDYSSPGGIGDGTYIGTIDLSALGINVGNNPRTEVLPVTGASRDSSIFAHIGKTGLGDIDISDDGNTLYVMNLNNGGELVLIDITNPSTPTLIAQYPVPNPECSNSEYQGFAVKHDKGRVLISVTCSAETSQNRADLKGIIYEFVANGFTEIVEIPFDYDRGCVWRARPTAGSGSKACLPAEWQPWISEFIRQPAGAPTGAYSNLVSGNEHKITYYPQPLISDIEVDNDGSLIIGVMNRHVHQIGNYNYNQTQTNLFLEELMQGIYYESVKLELPIF